MRYTIKHTVHNQYLKKVSAGSVHRSWWCFDYAEAGKYTLARCNEILAVMRSRKISTLCMEISPAIPAPSAATEAV